MDSRRLDAQFTVCAPPASHLRGRVRWDSHHQSYIFSPSGLRQDWHMGFVFYSSSNILEVVTKSTVLSRALNVHLGLMGRRVITDSWCLPWVWDGDGSGTQIGQPRVKALPLWESSLKKKTSLGRTHHHWRLVINTSYRQLVTTGARWDLQRNRR